MSSSLSDHIFKKGKFITPWNAHFGSILRLQSWSLTRLPEYIWLGLILEKYGRNKGMEMAYFILKRLHDINNQLPVPAFSLIKKLDIHEQNKFFSYIIQIIDKQTLAPLTLLYTYSDFPEFSKWFCDSQITLTERQEKLTAALNDSYLQHSDTATDIRFLVLYFALFNGNMVMPKDELELILEYPYLDHTNEKMRLIRPTVRVAEMGLLNLETLDSQFIDDFWRRISKVCDCKLFYVTFPSNKLDANKYIDLLHEVFYYLTNCFTSTNPLDKKMLVLLGISTYSYKRVIEIVEHDLYNTIAARSTIRTVIECYIMMKYLEQNEAVQGNIWDKYQYYGIGLYKIILARAREAQSDISNNHIDYKYLELLVNEYIDEEFIDMDTTYFNKQTIREKANSVGENELYGLYYDYDSSYEHGLWGAIRESSLLKCESPAHQYHCVPDYENNQNLKNVWPDCIMIMNKIITMLNDLYSIPEPLYKEVMNYAK